MTIETVDRPTEILDLITLEPKDALAVFSAKREDGQQHPIDPLLAKVRAAINGFKGDVSTRAGRDEIKRMAMNVVKSKTYLEKIGAALAKEQKEIPKRIDATRNHIEKTLDAYRDEVREPLTQWEAKESARILRHQTALNDATARSKPTGPDGRPLSSDALRANLASLEAFSIGPDCEEFADEYRLVISTAIPVLKSAIADCEKYEQDQADLERLRQAEADRAQKERDEKLRKEGEDRARLDAENDLRIAVLAADAECRKAQDEAAVQALAAQREIEAANARAAAAEAKAKADLEAKQRTEATENAARAADKEHRRAINAAALQALVSGGVPDEIAKKVIALIASGKVPSCTMNY